MEKSEVVKYLGLFVFAVMALSMIAAVFIYNPNTSTTTGEDPFPQAQENTFTYSLSFDTRAIKELSAMRFAAVTSEPDKVLIDNMVFKTPGVSKVSSTFRKEKMDDNSWVYLAEITSKKDTDLSALANSIGDLNVFDKEQGFDSMKYISVSVPSSVMIHNTDLNIDRNYSFTTTTLSSIARQSTVINDEITVGGTIQLKGNVILALELVESVNKTQAAQMDELLKQMQIDENKSVDVNAPAQ